MSKIALYGFDIIARPNGANSVGMTQVMETNTHKPRSIADRLEMPACPVMIKYTARLVCKDKVVWIRP